MDQIETVDAARPAYVRAAAVVVSNSGADWRRDEGAGRYFLAVEESESVGGADTGPSLAGLPLSALGSCYGPV
ncbi:hypothetical protein [Streptomyces sp. NBC_00038]|uniref:hypothetical protein n=1 Tax=Streptomyces sp. NBC_00038 TaxID=2903615 RepID=UPI002259F5A4|nr:hypothetical protein [Streptomyces sp. NBC_00038]MCX5555418.1 hypothetical protein [Streptomyces sp. NBC_00038]